MCGLVGICSKDNKKIQSFPTKKLLKILFHRGPDDNNSTRLGNALFAHTRLSIIGLSSEKANQPIYNKDYMLMFNGEIYNYVQLKHKLDKQKIKSTGESDTEILFLCLINFGIQKTLKMIDGMFAFAFYDNSKKKLFLARDRIGEKFVYWFKDKNSFFFASEIKTLLNVNEFSFRPNLNRINEFFYHGKVYGQETMFEDIYELEPGSYLEYSPKQSQIKISSYFKLENFKQTPVYNDIFEEFGQKISKAVETRMVSDVPIGSLVSGGIDSTTLIERMLNIKDIENLNLFFYDTKSKEINEKKDLQLFFKNISNNNPSSNIKLHTITKPVEDFLNDFHKMTYFNDEPLGPSNFQLVYELSKKAKQEKIKVIFSGEGADEIFFGYDRFFATSLKIKKKNNQYNKLKEIYFGSGINNSDFISKITNDKKTSFESSFSWKYLDKINKNFEIDTVQMLFSQKFRLGGLLQRQDRAAMANSVESRAPFLAPDFVNWVNGLPNKFKRNINEKKNKLILKDYMHNKIPQQIINKEKLGFITDFDIWLRSGQFHNHLKKIIMQENSFSSTYLNQDLILQLLNFKKSKSNNFFYILYKIFCLEIWYKVFFSNECKNIIYS